MARENLLPKTDDADERIEAVRNLLFIGARSLGVWKRRLELASLYLPEPRFDEESDIPLNESAELQAVIDMVAIEHLAGAVESLSSASETTTNLPSEFHTADTRPVPTAERTP